MADALLYSHLLVATQCAALKDIVAGYGELLEFYEHMRQTHFAEDPVYRPPAPVASEASSVPTTGQWTFNPNTTRALIIGTVVLYIAAVRFL